MAVQFVVRRIALPVDGFLLCDKGCGGAQEAIVIRIHALVEVVEKVEGFGQEFQAEPLAQLEAPLQT